MDYLKRRAVYDSFESFRIAKDNTIHTFAKIGRKHRWLKWPIFFVCVIFIFLFNLFYHFFMKFEMQEKLAIALSYVMIGCLLLTSITIPAFAFNSDENTYSVTKIVEFESLSDDIAFQHIQQGEKESSIIFPDYVRALVNVETYATVENETGETVADDSSSMNGGFENSDNNENDNNTSETEENVPEIIDNPETPSADGENDVIVPDGNDGVDTNLPATDIEDNESVTNSDNEASSDTASEGSEVNNADTNDGSNEGSDESIFTPEPLPEESNTEDTTPFVAPSGDIEADVPSEETGAPVDEAAIRGYIADFINTFKPLKTYASELENSESGENASLSKEVKAEENVKEEINAGEIEAETVREKADTVENVKAEGVKEEGKSDENTGERIYKTKQDKIDIPVEWVLNESLSSKSKFSSRTVENIFVYEAVAKGDYEIDPSVSMPVITVKITEFTGIRFDYTNQIDDVLIRVMADPGVFPEGSTLSVRKVNVYEEKLVEEAVTQKTEENNDETVNVAKSYTYDIKVFSPDGAEIEPDTEMGEVYVSFELKEVSDVNLETNLYHIEANESGLNVTELEYVTEGDEVIAQTSGFSFYTVQFTYNSLEYLLAEGDVVPLADILKNVNLTGTVTNASSTNTSYLDVYKDKSVWYVEAVKAFDETVTSVTLTVTINGTSYNIAVKQSEKNTLVLGNFDYKSKSFSKASGTGSGKYVTLSIYVTNAVVANSDIIKLPSVSGYSLTSYIKNATYVITISGDGKTPNQIASEYISKITFSDYENQKVGLSFELATADAKLTYNGSARNEVPIKFEGNDHYYVYISFSSNTTDSWINSFNAAKGMSYARRQGYLATVTSYDEDMFVYKQSGGKVGWLGGSTASYSTGSGLYCDVNISSESTGWHWLCGPEKGNLIFDVLDMDDYSNSSKKSEIYTRNKNAGRYFNWNDGEPNHDDNKVNCLTTLMTGKGYSTQTTNYSWNDIVNSRAYDATYAAKGYMVEFGDMTIGDSNDSPLVTATAHISNYSATVEASSITVADNSLSKTWNTFDDTTDVDDFVFYDSVPTVSIYPTKRDAYISAADYYISSKPLSELKVKQLAETEWTPYRSEFPLTEGGINIIYVRHKNEKTGNTTYISSKPIVVSESAITAWFIKDSEGNIVGFGSGSIEDALNAGSNDSSKTIVAVVRDNKDATTDNTIPANVEISLPAGTTVSVSGDSVTNTSGAGTYVVLETSTKGLQVSTPKNGTVSVNDMTYKNASAENSMEVAVDADDNVILTGGEVRLDKGASINVLKEDEMISLENTSSSASDNQIVVSGATNTNVKLDQNATVTVTSSKESSTNNTYTSHDGKSTLTVVDDTNVLKLSSGKIELSGDNTVYVGENKQTVRPKNDDDNALKVNADGNVILDEKQSVEIGGTVYTATEEGATLSGTDNDTMAVLKEGSIELNKDTMVAVVPAESEGSQVVYTTVGSNNPVIYADGSVKVINDSKVLVTNETGNKTNEIEVPENGLSDNNSLTVSTASDGAVDVNIKKGEEVKINGNTYKGAGDDDDTAKVSINLNNKEAVLTEGDIELEKGSSIIVATSDDDSTVNTKIVANTDENPTISSTGKVDIPAGGKVTASVTVKDNDGKDITVTNVVEAPAKTDEETGETSGDTVVTVKGTNIELELNDNESVKVNNREIKANKDDTTLTINENGATLTSGGVSLEKDEEIVVNGSVVKNTGSEGSSLSVLVNNDETTTINVANGEEYTVSPAGSDETIVFKALEGEDVTEYTIDKDGNHIVGEEGLPIVVGGKELTVCGGQGENNELLVKVTSEGVEILTKPGEDIVIKGEDGEPVTYKNAGEGTLLLVLDENEVPVLKGGSLYPAPGTKVSVLVGDKTVNIGTDTENAPESVIINDDGTAVIKKDAKIKTGIGSKTQEITANTDEARINIGDDSIELINGGITTAEKTPVSVNGYSLESYDGPMDVSLDNGNIVFTAEPGKMAIISDTNGTISIKNNGEGKGTYTLAGGFIDISDGDEIVINNSTAIIPSENTTVSVKPEGDEAVIKVPLEGDSFTLTSGGKTGTYTTTGADSVFKSTSDGVLLSAGGVILSVGSEIGIETGDGNKKTFVNVASISGECPQVTRLSDGKSEVLIPAGSELKIEDSDATKKDIVIKNTDAEAKGFSINSDGSIQLSSEQTVDLTIDNVDFNVSSDGDIKIENSKDGVTFTIPADKTITIFDKSVTPYKEITYTNSGSSDLVIDMDKDGDIALLSGELGLKSGDTIYMSDGNGNQVPVTANGNAIRINSDGDIVLPTDTSVSIDSMEYKGSTASDEGNGKATLSLNDNAGVPVLKSGNVELGNGASIGIAVGDQIEKITNKGTKPVDVAAAGSVTVPSGGKAEIKVKNADGSEKTDVLEVPENASPVTAKTENASEGYKITYEVLKTGETGKAEIKINGATYSADSDFKLVTDSQTGEKTLGTPGSDTVSVQNGSIVVGDTKVEATKNGMPVIVTKDGTGKADIKIPAGSTAKISAKDADGNIVENNIQVPSNAEEPVNVKTLSTGKLGLELKENEKIMLNGGEVVAKADDTQISIGTSGASLETGHVALGDGAGIIVNGSKVDNTGNGAPVDITKNGEETTVLVAPGGSYTVSDTANTDNTNTYEFKNNGSDPASYTISETGDLEIPGNTSVPVSINGSNPVEIKSDNQINVKVGSDGVSIEVKPGADISIGNSTFKNADDSNGLELVLNEKGETVLEKGNAKVGEGATLVLLKDSETATENDTRIEIRNDTTPGHTAPTVEMDENGVIKAEEGASIKVSVTNPSTNTVKTESYISKDSNTEILPSPDGNILSKGSVSFKNGSGVIVSDGHNDYSIANANSKGTVTAKKADDNSINVSVTAGGTVEIAGKGSDDTVSFTNIKASGEVSYTLSEDKSVKANTGDIVEYTSNGKNTVIESSSNTAITVKPSEEGLSIDFEKADDSIIVKEEIAPGQFRTSTITATSESTKLIKTSDGVKLNRGSVELGENSTVFLGESGITSGKNNGISIVAPTPGVSDGSITIPANGTVTVSKPGQTSGAYTISIPSSDGFLSDNTTLSVAADGGIKVPAGKEITVTTNSGTPRSIKTSGNEGSGLVLMPGTNGPVITLAAGETLIIDGKEYKNDSSTKAEISLTSDGKVVVESGNCMIPAGETVFVENTDAKGNKGLVPVRVPAVELNEGETVTGGDLTIKVVKNVSGESTIYTETTPQIVTSQDGVTSTVDATLSVGKSTYKAVSTPDNQASLSISTNAETGEVKLEGGAGNYEVTNGNLTIGNDTFETSGNLPVSINRPSTLVTPTVDVPAGGNITVGNKLTGTEMEVKIPKEASEKVTVNVNREDGQIEATLRDGESIIVGGIEYSSEEGGRLFVDAETGKLDETKSTTSPDIKVDPSSFNKENYTVTVPQNKSITVGDKVYTSKDGSFTLNGNSDGAPVITVAKSGDSVTVGDKTYTTASNNSKFSVADNGNITLESEGSSLKLDNKATYVIDGIKYTSTVGTYTVAKEGGKALLDTGEDGKVSVVLPPNSNIVIRSDGAADFPVSTSTSGVEIHTSTYVDQDGNKVIKVDRIQPKAPSRPSNNGSDDTSIEEKAEDNTAVATESDIQKVPVTVGATIEEQEEIITEIIGDDSVQEVFANTFEDLENVEVEKSTVVVSLGEGTITVIASTSDDETNSEDALKVRLNGVISEIVRICLTQEEIDMVLAGASVDIKLSVISDDGFIVSKDDKEKVESEIARLNSLGGEYILGRFVDVTLEKDINNSGWEKIHYINEDLTIVLEVPEDIRKDGRTYYVMRKHEDEFSLLDDVDRYEYTISFMTDRFSTYAILYTEKTAESIATGVGDNSENIEDISEETPVTPEKGCNWWYLLIILLIITAVTVAVRANKKKKQ